MPTALRIHQAQTGLFLWMPTTPPPASSLPNLKQKRTSFAGEVFMNSGRRECFIEVQRARLSRGQQNRRQLPQLRTTMKCLCRAMTNRRSHYTNGLLGSEREKWIECFEEGGSNLTPPNTTTTPTTTEGGSNQAPPAYTTIPDPTTGGSNQAPPTPHTPQPPTTYIHPLKFTPSHLLSKQTSLKPSKSQSLLKGARPQCFGRA
jgi:hypothetical protein